jgi:hypothetical protein
MGKIRRGEVEEGGGRAKEKNSVRKLKCQV